MTAEFLRFSIIVRNIIAILIIYYLKRVALKKKYKSYDLLYPQGGDFFFSERIIDAMQKENIVGYDIIKGGCFYEEIVFI